MKQEIIGTVCLLFGDLTPRSRSFHLTTTASSTKCISAGRRRAPWNQSLLKLPPVKSRWQYNQYKSCSPSHWNPVSNCRKPAESCHVLPEPHWGYNFVIFCCQRQAEKYWEITHEQWQQTCWYEETDGGCLHRHAEAALHSGMTWSECQVVWYGLMQHHRSYRLPFQRYLDAQQYLNVSKVLGDHSRPFKLQIWLSKLRYYVYLCIFMYYYYVILLICLQTPHITQRPWLFFILV